ncbi:MAG: ABC transporter permease [Fimbriimonadales bacterium]|nr:ABC transporter permease [Fimbriimonadales bacterium]
MAAIRAALLDWRKYLAGIFTQILANPVIGRELRVRVRLGRGYLLQAAYLAFMILIVALAYEWVIGDENNLRNPFQMQNALKGFYYTVLGTLIALIVLIAPALTANAITLERERRTMDLLLATPLTARHLLAGKLLASFAFIVLLLALTLPVNAVSVLLGGVSFGDLLRAYVIVACGGLVLCSIALFTSVYARNSTIAVLWSYLRVGAFLLLSLVLFGLQETVAGFGGRMGGGAGAVNLHFPVAMLNPFSALIAADTQVDLIRWQVPSWIFGVVLCLLFTRLVMTSAARKVGLYDKDVMPSLRRQLLLLLPGYVLVTAIPVLRAVPIARMGVGGVDAAMAALLTLLCVAPFLTLAAWIAPFGKDEDKECPDDGAFRLSKMLTAAPSGALPFLLMLWLLMLGAFLLALYWTGTLAAFDITLWEISFTTILYLTGMWIFFWGVGRFSAWLLKGMSLVGARALALGIIATIITLPLIVHLLFFVEVWESPAMKIWIFTPFYEVFTNLDNPSNPLTLFVWGCVLLVLGILLGMLTEKRNKG